jgi:hypothetical protein
VIEAQGIEIDDLVAENLAQDQIIIGLEATTTALGNTTVELGDEVALLEEGLFLLG